MGGKKGDMMEKKPRRDTGETQESLNTSPNTPESNDSVDETAEVGGVGKTKRSMGKAGVLLAQLLNSAPFYNRVEYKCDRQVEQLHTDPLTKEGERLADILAGKQPMLPEDEELLKFLRQTGLLRGRDLQGNPQSDALKGLEKAIHRQWKAVYALLTEGRYPYFPRPLHLSLRKGESFCTTDTPNRDSRFPTIISTELLAKADSKNPDDIAEVSKIIDGILKKIFSPHVVQYMKIKTWYDELGFCKKPLVTGFEPADFVIHRTKFMIAFDPEAGDDGRPLKQLMKHAIHKVKRRRRARKIYKALEGWFMERF